MEAVTLASEGDTILIAPGTYEGPDNRNITTGEGGCGECDTPVEQTTWGSIKGLYR